MTAQQQLAELNAVCSRLWSQRHSESEAAAFYNKAGTFIRDHGPAIAELVETALVGKSMRDAYIAKFGPSDSEVVMQLHDRIDAAIRKLTQEAMA